MNEIYNILEEIRPSADFKNSKNFIDDGILDSFDVVSLVAMLEDKYNIKIDGTKILIENFVSVDAIMNLIKECGGKI